MGAHTANFSRIAGRLAALGLVCSANAALADTRTPPTATPDNVTLWFSSALRAQGVSSSRPVTICMTKQLISWTEGGKTRTLSLPDAQVAFKPWESTAHTYYGRGWDSSAPPVRAPGDTFASGIALFTGAIPRAMMNISWTANFASDTPGVVVTWRWSVAAYSRFPANYNDLQVTPIDVRTTGVKPAGSPLAIEPYLIFNSADRFFFGGTGNRGMSIAPVRNAGCGGSY
jgi:hypothetical protein